LKIRQFLEKPRIRNEKDFTIQNQLFAYFVSKHYGISLQEVLTMPIDTFFQSLNWAIVMEEREKAQNENRTMQSRTSNETITLDYGFLNDEGEAW